MKFDYDAPGVPDSAIADVVAAIRNHGKLPPLSDEERAQRRLASELYRLQCQMRDDQRAFEYQERQAEAEAIARAEAAAALAETNRKARLQRDAEISRQTTQRELADLRFQSAQQRGWISSVENSFRAGVIQKQRQKILDDLTELTAPPASPPETNPEPIAADDDLGSPNIGDEDFNPRYWLRKPIFRR